MLVRTNQCRIAARRREGGGIQSATLIDQDVWLELPILLLQGESRKYGQAMKVDACWLSMRWEVEGEMSAVSKLQVPTGSSNQPTAGALRTITFSSSGLFGGRGGGGEEVVVG